VVETNVERHQEKHDKSDFGSFLSNLNIPSLQQSLRPIWYYAFFKVTTYSNRFEFQKKTDSILVLVIVE